MEAAARQREAQHAVAAAQLCDVGAQDALMADVATPAAVADP
jgi:hypothetical protein